MLNTALASSILAFMVAKYPVENHRFLGVSDEYTMTRYRAIAADIADVALDPDEPPLFRSDAKLPEFDRFYDGRIKTAFLLASVARFESGGFREDVDNMTKTGDGGKAVCLLQIHLWENEIVTDRPSCLRAGLRHMRESYRMCHSLSGYTVGHCVKNEPQAIQRMKMAEEWLHDHPFHLESAITVSQINQQPFYGFASP